MKSILMGGINLLNIEISVELQAVACDAYTTTPTIVQQDWITWILLYSELLGDSMLGLLALIMLVCSDEASCISLHAKPSLSISVGVTLTCYH